jgi:hypothetical protein
MTTVGETFSGTASDRPKRGRHRTIRLAETNVPNRPARFPDHGAWPAEMRADLVAAFLDYPNTRALVAGIVNGDAPRASSFRYDGGTRELTWYLEGLKAFVASRHGGQVITRPGPRLLDVIPTMKK